MEFEQVIGDRRTIRFFDPTRATARRGRTCPGSRTWTGRGAVANGNVVRGFMIRKGAVSQSGVWRG
jgi:hypothetical protein